MPPPISAEIQVARTSGPGFASTAAANATGFANLLKPIETPLVFSGFSEDAMQMFAQQFASAGVTPVMGAGSVEPREAA